MSKHEPLSYDFWVYILTNWKKTVLYVGVTNNLRRRLIEHYQNRENKKTFTGQYHCFYLIYYEWYQYADQAIIREKEIKKMLRRKKEALIAEDNPDWVFFNSFICGKWPPSENN